MHTLVLDDAEVTEIQRLAEALAGAYDTVEAPALQRAGRVLAADLPRRVRADLEEFRLTETSAALLITGWPVVDEPLGPTPADAHHKPVPSPSLRHDLAFFLVACLLGDPVGWATQQDGYVMHDVYPVRGYEHAQIGWGSEQTLTWHTEDAFHPLRTDYLGLLCLRNPDQVPTTVADMADVDLDEPTRAVLAQERFRLVPDDSHRGGAPGPGEAGRAAELRRRGRDRVDRALAAPEPVAVLFGDLERPYVRLDPAYMLPPEDQVEQQALDRLCAAIDAALTDVVLTAGDMVFIDNYRAVHGRKPFRARFDGTDRWLRRLNVTRDLRRSRASRLAPDSRVIH